MNRQDEQSVAIDGSRIMLTHDELNAILDQEKQFYADKEKELIMRKEREIQQMIHAWHKKLERRKKKKRDMQDRIRMLNEQVATLQKRNTDLREQVNQYEKERKNWATYVLVLFSKAPLFEMH